MKAELFFTSEDKTGIPLYLLSSEDLSRLDSSDAEQICMTHQQYNGKLGDSCIFYTAEGSINKVYIGTDGTNNNALALAHAASFCPPGVYTLKCEVSKDDLIHWALAQYRFDYFKNQNREPRILTVDQDMQTAVIQWTEALFLVRDLINRPTSDLGPKELADTASKLADRYSGEFKQWVGDELLKDNFPAIHAVGRASQAEPRLLFMAWGDKKAPLITLIGKGVCFDSGGLNIKPSQGMRLMKKDMGGAAQVLGLAQWIMSNQLSVRLEVYIPAVENAVGSDAFRPGDVITMRSGLTVEIDNTDAEGRLVLADAMVKASEANPELLIDFSTLTGAARVALGTDISAMFSSDDTVAEALTGASQTCHDPIWRLPLFKTYEPMLKSTIADLSNCADSPYAGAITAALFLQHFIPKSLPWVHFDIMAWNLSHKPGKPEGGEAMAIRAVGHYLQARFGSG